MPESTGEQFTIDGARADLAPGDRGKPLAEVLRETHGKTGTHLGCQNGDCGACTVLIDGRSFKSCLMPAARAVDRDVTTIQGVANSEALSNVQQTFWDDNAFQCGFCLAGHLLCTVELLPDAGTVTVEDVNEAIAGNLCRCTGYEQIRNAAFKALSNESDR